MKELEEIGPDEWSMQVSWLDVDELVPNSENPNQQDDATFNGLVASIEQDGWTVPVTAVLDEESGRYRIVAGEHRWRAAKVLMCKVPVICLDPEKWHEDRQATNLVKDNILKGKLDPLRFTQLYDRLQKDYGDELLKELMGFTTEDAFQRVYKATVAGLPPELQKALAESKVELKTIDDLSSVLNGLFREFGETLPSNYMVFSYGSRDVFWVRADKDLWGLLTTVRKRVDEQKLDMTAEMVDALEQLIAGYQAGDEFAATEEGSQVCTSVSVPTAQFSEA